MDARPRRYCHVVLHRLTSEEIRRHTSKNTNTSKTSKSSPKSKNKTYKHSTPTRWRPKMTVPSRVNKNNIVEHSAHSKKYHISTAVMPSYLNKNETAEDSARISKQQNLKIATQTYVNKYKTGEDSARISKQQNSKMATQSYVNKYKTGEDCARISKQQNSGKAIPRCVIDRTTEDNVLIAPKAILKRRKSDSIVETRQNSTKQDNNSCDNQRTSKKQRIKNDYFVKTHNNKDENIIVPPRKRKSDSEFETQSTLRSISNQPFEILPKKRRQETSVCDNTEKSITNTKVTTASKFIKIQNSNFYSQLSCNQSTASKNKDTEKETVNGEKANVTIIDNSEILQSERVETYSEMQKNQRQSSKNLEIDNEDIAVVYDNFYTEDRKLNGPSHDINILNGNPEYSPTYRSEINNASRKNSHDKVENSRKLLNSMPVYNPNKRYFKMFTAAYENSLKKSPLFQIKNLYRMAQISELDLSSSFGYGNQFSSHLTNKINNNVRLPIDTSEYRFDTVCDLNESFLFNLIAAEDIDKLKLSNLQNIECVIYYSCKVNKILSSVTRTNFAGRIILTGDTKHLIKYPADLKDKYSLNTNKRDFPHLKRRSIDKDIADTISPSNETDVYFTLREMIQGISKKYEKQKHWYHCKCCCSPFGTYNELEPICPTCNIYCTLDFHLKHFDSKGFSKISQRRSFISHKIKHIYSNNATNIPKLDKRDLVKELSEKNISASKDSAKILTSVEDELIHKTPVNLETFENTNPINNTCFHLMNGSPVTGRQESQQELLVENTDEGEIVNTSAELIMLDTSEGCGEHETYLLFAVENDAMPEQKSKDLQVVENLESEITDEKDGCEEQDDAILLKSTKHIQLENAMLPSLDAEPQGQDDDDSNIQFILLHDSNSGEISPTVEVTVADDEQNLSINNSVLSCTAQSIGTTSISEPDSSEIQIIEYTSICQSSTDTPNLPLTTSDVSKDLFQNSVVPTCISNPNSPEIQIIEDTPIKSSSDAYNPKLHSSTIDEPEENLSEKSPIPTCISQAENPEIQIIEDTPIKSSSEAYNPKLHSTTIDEPEKNLSKKSPIPTCISLPEIQIIEESSVCLSPNDTSNPKLPSDTIDRTEKTLTENSSKPSSISQSDSSGIRIIECTSISQSVDMPNLPSTTTDVSDDLSENSLLTTDISHCFALKIQIIEYNSVCQFSDAQDPKLLTTDESVLKIPVVIDSIEMPSNMEDNVVNNEGHLSENSLEPICNSHSVSPKIQILEYKSLCQSDPKLLSNLTEESEENLSENSQMTTRISQSDTPKIQILNYNSICKSSRDIQDPKLPSAKSPNPTADDSNLNIPVIQSVKSLADTINSTNELLWNSGISDKVIFSRTLPTSSVTDTSINSIEEATLEEEVQRKAAENANSTLERDFCDISDTKDHSESNLIPGRDNYINGCNSESSLRLSTERESTEHDIESNSISHEFLNSQSSKNSPTKKAKKDDDDFTPTLPIVNVSPINSKEEVPLEEKVERENEENSNYTHVRNVCELSDTKDHSESNITSDIASYMNECHSENSSQVNMDAGESTERNTPKSNSFSPEFLISQNSNNLSLKTEKEGGDYTHTLPPANVNESFISCTEEIPLEEVVQIKTAKNSNCAVERDFSGAKDHSESDFISDRDSYLNDSNSENSLQVCIDIEESTKVIPEINSLSREFLNSQKGKKDEDHYTHTVQTASVNDSPIISSKDVSVEEHVLRQTAENSKFSLERDFCDVSDTKDHSEYNFTSDKGSYMNDSNSKNSLQVSRDTGESTEHDVPEVNSMTHELLNSPNSNDLPLKKTKKDSDVSDSSVSSTEELPLEEMQRKNSKNSNYAPERNFCDFGDVKNHNESNSSSNFVYFEEDFPRVFLKYVRVLEDLLPQEIISVKRSNADGSENAYLILDMLGIASTIASLDILNDYAKVSKFIDFVSKCIYYLENHENRDELKILKTKYFLKKLYVINDFIEKYGTYDKLVEDLLKNGGKISAWDCNRGAAKEGNRVRYSNIDPKLSKMKSFLVTKGDSSTKGTTSNICDTYLKLLNNPALLADVNQQTSSKYRNPYDKCCALANCKECNIYSDRNEDKLETIVIASEVYDESNAHMSSELKNSNSHESGTLLYNRGLRLENCIKKIKNMNEPLSSDVSLDSELRTSTSPSKIITYDSISPISRTVSENLVTADSSQLNNTSCLLDYSRVVEALTTDKNSEVSQNRLSPQSLMNEVLKGKRSYRKRSDKAIKEKRTYKKRNVKPTHEQLPILTSPISSLSQSIDTPVTTQEQLPILTSPISSLSQSIDTPVVGFKPKGNAPLIPLCNQNESLKVSQEQQPASANPSIPLCNLNSSLHMDQGQQYPLANLSVPLCNQSAILIDQEQPLDMSQTSGNMHYNCKTNPHFDYRMPSHSSPSQIPWHTPITQSSSVQGVPHITGASFTSDALVQKNVRQTDSSSSSHCSVQTSVTTRTDISVETQYASSLRHLANFASESRTSNTSRGEFSNYEKNIQNTRTFTGSRAVPYPPQCMPRYPETFSLLPPLYSSQTLSSTSQPSSQYMYPGHHPYPCQCYPSMPHCSSTMTQPTPIIPPSFYTQSSYSSSQSTPIIPPSSYRQSSHSSSQSTPIIPPSSYIQSSYSSSQSTPTISPSSYTQSSYSSSQSTPIIPPSSYRQSSHSSSQSTPIIPPSSYIQSSYSSSQSTPTISPSSYTQSSYSSSQSTPIIPPSSYRQSSHSSSQSTPIIPPSSYIQSSYSSSQSTPTISPSSYTQSSYSSSQSTPIIPPSSYRQSSHSSSQSTPIIPPSSYTQSSYLSSQSTPISPASSYMHSSYSSFQPSPSFQRTPYPSPRMQRSSSDPRTLPHLHQMNLPYIHSKYK